MDIRLDLNGVTPFIQSLNEIDRNSIHSAYQKLIDKSGKGNDFLGWIDLPEKMDQSFINDIKQCALNLQKISEVVVVIGIGGSYLGARAVIDSILCSFRKNTNSKYPEIVYAGNNLSETYHYDLIQLLNQKEYSVIVISKSGTTTEPAIAFRLIKEHCENKYGKGASERIVAITDQKRGVLKKLATENRYTTYTIPDDVGGRYSVLTPVGLLPIATTGIDISLLISGAKDMKQYLYENSNLNNNIALQYALYRNLLYRSGKKIEMMVSFEPKLYFLIEWFKQLFGESEGKELKGIFPTGAIFSTDLHSLGQYIQEGERILFETFLSVQQSPVSLPIPHNPSDLDGLNYLDHRSIHEINLIAEEGTRLAHLNGNVPNFRIEIPSVSEYYLGQLIYFFEFSCALGGYLLDINPFDQPGVEAYKKNMFQLLGKP
jgi:glucose-6-phosphate isomerase